MCTRGLCDERAGRPRADAECRRGYSGGSIVPFGTLAQSGVNGCVIIYAKNDCSTDWGVHGVCQSVVCPAD